MLNAEEKKRLKLLQAKLAAAQSSGSAVDLTADDERFLDAVALKSEKQSIRKKALAGGTLTGAQRARLSGSVEVDDAVTFVQNWNELADAIPIDRRTLQNFRNDHAELIEQNKKQLLKSDGRKCVPEWRTLIAECGVKGRGSNNSDPNSLDARELDLAERRVRLRQAEVNLLKSEDRLLPVAQFERAWFKTHAALLAAINAFGPRVNEMLQGLDYNDRAAVLEDECERLRATIAECDYLAPEEQEDGG